MQNNSFKINLLASSLARTLVNVYRPRPQFPRQRVHRKTSRAKMVARKFWPQTRRKRYAAFSDHQKLVNSLTNWQRSQWARDGYVWDHAKHCSTLVKS